MSGEQYAVYASLMDPRKNGSSGAGSGTILLCAILIPFFISTAYWVICFVEQIVRLKYDFGDRSHRYDGSSVDYATLFNVLVLLNVSSEPLCISRMPFSFGSMFRQYIFGDGVLVWRAYALCKLEYARWLLIPLAFLVLTVGA